MKSGSGSNRSGRKRSFLGMFYLFLIAFVIFIIALIGVVVFTADWYLTPSRVEKISSRLIKEHLGQNLEMQGVHFSLFNGFEFRNIQLYSDSDQDSLLFPLGVQYAKSIQFKYSLWPLLKKQLVFNKLVIDSADFVLNIPASAPEKSAIEEKIKSEPDTSQINDLPITVDIREISLNNAKITLNTSNDTSRQSVCVGNISVMLKELFIPRENPLAKNSGIHGELVLAAKNTPVIIEQVSAQSNMRFETELNFLSKLSFRSLSDILFSMKASLSKTHFQQTIKESGFTYDLPFPVLLQMDAVVDMHEESVIVNPVSFQVNQSKWIEVQARVESLSTRPFLQLDVLESRVPLVDVLEMSLPLIPDTLLRDYYFHNNKAFLSLKGTQINGYIPADTLALPLILDAVMRLDQFGITLNSGEALLQNFNLNTRITSKFSGTEHQNTKPFLIVQYDSLYIEQPQGIPFFSGPGRAEVETHLTHLFYPSRAKFSLNFPNLMNASLFSHFNLYSQNGVQGLSGSGELELSHLELDQIPDLPVSGHFNTKIKFTSNTLDSMAAKILCFTDELTVFQDDLSYSIPPLRLDNDLRIHSDSLFQKITVDSFHLSLNDILSAEAKASINVTRGILFSFKMPEFLLDHQRLLDILPVQASVKNDIDLTGITRIKADAQGHLGIEGVEYAASVLFTMDSTKIATPEAELNGITVRTKAELDEKLGIIVNGILDCDQAVLESVRSQPLTNTSLNFHFNTTDFIHYHIDTTVLTVPDLFLKAVLNSDFQTLPSTAGSIRADIKMSPPRMTDLIDDVSMIGVLQAKIKAQADSSNIDLTAEVKSDGINMYLAPGGIVENLKINLFIQQGFDLSTGLFTGRKFSLVQTPVHSAPDYALHQNYFSRQEKSKIQIDSIMIGAYKLTDAVLEGYFGQGHIEIPNFYVNLYDGNIGGRFSMDAAGKAPKEVTYTLTSHISGINSALILPDSREEKKQSIVDANAEVNGISIDPDAGIDLNGYFYITTIGSKFADNLLRSMDPKGRDSGIRSARMLLNRGLKPKLFSFEIQNGYFYPSISFKQPWYMPVRLSGSRIEFTRIPINYLLQ